MLYTTFAKLRKAGACKDEYKIFAKKMGGIQAYGKDTPIPLTTVFDKMGLNDALWCLNCTQSGEEEQKLSRLLATDFAEHIDASRAEAKIEQNIEQNKLVAWDAEREWQTQHFREMLEN